MINRFSQTKHSLLRDETGVTIVEFAIVAPVLMILIMGIFDIAHTQYTSALVNGAMQNAGRNLTLESAGANENAIDQIVIDQVRNVVPASAEVTLEKLSHFDFGDIGEAEEFNDENGDGICNNNELFSDANGNAQWDANRGREGIGGARDAVLYTAVVTFPRLFPIHAFTDLEQEITIEASTVLRNQPFSEQNRNVETGNCP